MPANPSQGTVLKKASAIIGDVTSVSIAGITRAEIDVTALADAAKKYMMGTVDSGTIEVGFNYDEAIAAYIPATTENVSSAWSITVNTAEASTQIISFNAFVQSFSVEAGVDAALTGSLTLRIDGAVTFNTPSGGV